MKHRTILKTLHALLLASFIANPAFLAAADETIDSFRQIEADISASILSPYCPGRLLRDCPSGAAQELREQIYTSLKEGKSKELVLNELYLRFGEEELRAVPEKQGFGLLAWIIPPLFLMLGFLLIVWWTFRNKTDEPDAAKEGAIDDDTLKRIEEEIHDSSR